MPESAILLDTGPLVAYFNPRDEHHAWAVEVFAPLEPPLITCEAVLAEAFYLVSKSHNGFDLLGAFCESGALRIDFRILDNAKPLRDLLYKYRDVPMDLADACLVLLAEEHENAVVLTTDRDFLTYRTRTRRHIRLIAPFAG